MDDFDCTRRKEAKISNRLLDFPHIWSAVAGIGIGIRAVNRQRTADDDVPPSLVSFVIVDDEDGCFVYIPSGSEDNVYIVRKKIFAADLKYQPTAFVISFMQYSCFHIFSITEDKINIPCSSSVTNKNQCNDRLFLLMISSTVLIRHFIDYYYINSDV